MRKLSCKKNTKAKDSDDCYNCFEKKHPEASRVLCVKYNAKYEIIDEPIVVKENNIPPKKHKRPVR